MGRPLNPFEPNRPISPSRFVGREREVAELDAALVHLKGGAPRHFLVTGHRGIGKTSFLDFIRNHASNGDGRFNFLVVDFVIYRSATQSDLIRGIEAELERAVAEYDPFRDFIKKAWSFVRHIEAAGISIKDVSPPPPMPAIYKDAARALINTVNKICDQSEMVCGYDGVLILLDEVDQASSQLDLGTFLKYLLETLNREGCNRVAFGLAGLSSSREVLLSSHRSSLRIFDELALEGLSREDFGELMDYVIWSVRQNYDSKFDITPEAIDLIFHYSDGHPHFIHQFGYCAFEMAVLEDDGLLIKSSDVMRGAFSPRGAFDLLGDMYFRQGLENVESEGFAFQILDRMAESPGQCFAQTSLAGEVNCEPRLLGPLLRHMCDLSLLVEDKGSYRVRYTCFAYWYKAKRPQIV